MAKLKLLESEKFLKLIRLNRYLIIYIIAMEDQVFYCFQYNRICARKVMFLLMVR